MSSLQRLLCALPSAPSTTFSRALNSKRTTLSLLLPAAAFSAALSLAGCGLGSSVGPAATTTATGSASTMTGKVHGGQQGIAGASMALYAAGKTGVGSSPRALLSSPVITDSGGNFLITEKFTCQPNDEVYLLANGGSSGSGANNAIVMMAALGPCAPLQTTPTFVTVNEISTIGAVFSLSSFMNGALALGSAADTPGTNALAAAFATVQTMVDLPSGAALITSTGNGVVPQTTINSLANSLASCIDSDVSGSGCPSLFQATAVGGNTPADTLQATLNLARNPTLSTSKVFYLGGGSSVPFLPSLKNPPANYAIAVAHPSDVLMYHNDISRDGVQAAETALTPANVSVPHFGRKMKYSVDSYLYAQPLYAGGIGMPDGAVHNLLIAASSQGTVYAFDADATQGTGILWTVSLMPGGERFPKASDYFGCSNPDEAGIVGTPVIDRASQTIYIVSKSISTSSSTYYHRLHALSLIDGSERTGSPTVIAPTFSGSGDGSSGGVIAFNGQAQNERSALLLAPNASGGKTVWIAYASHCDHPPYHGIVLGYDGSSLANTATFIDTPNGSDGGIWMSNGGLAADAAGYIYASTGNGSFDVNTGGTDYGDAALKLAPPTIGAASPLMTVADYFVPYNQDDLNSRDLDVGGAEGILFTDAGSGVAPNLMIANDKNGSVYLINRDNMSHYNGPATSNKDIQDFTAGGVFIYNFSFFNNTLYTSNPIKAFTFNPGTLVTAGSFNETPLGQAGNIVGAPVVSANGPLASTTVVWAQDVAGTLHAYTSNLTEIYNTNQAGGQDAPNTFVKFTSPVIANGKVYLSGYQGISVYGLLP